jgi:hypothetical protein
VAAEILVSFRVRMKIWTDERGERWAAPVAIADPREVRLGEAIDAQTVLQVLVSNETGERVIAVTFEEWQRLPWFWFRAVSAAAPHEGQQLPVFFAPGSRGRGPRN